MENSLSKWVDMMLILSFYSCHFLVDSVPVVHRPPPGHDGLGHRYHSLRNSHFPSF